jgi:hypothetical protein
LVAESFYECHNVYMWLKAYKSIVKLLDYSHKHPYETKIKTRFLNLIEKVLTQREFPL